MSCPKCREELRLRLFYTATRHGPTTWHELKCECGYSSVPCRGSSPSPMVIQFMNNNKNLLTNAESWIESLIPELKGKERFYREDDAKLEALFLQGRFSANFQF